MPSLSTARASTLRDPQRGSTRGHRGESAPDHTTKIERNGQPRIWTVTSTGSPPLRFKGELLSYVRSSDASGTSEIVLRIFRRMDDRFLMSLRIQSPLFGKRGLARIEHGDDVETLATMLEDHDPVGHLPQAEAKAGQKPEDIIGSSRVHLWKGEIRNRFADCLTQTFEKFDL